MGFFIPIMYNLQEIRKTELGQETEHKIRYALGQRLTTFDSVEQGRPIHKRFDMSGDRDTTKGYYWNLEIFNLFNFPLYLDLSYNTEGLNIARNHDYCFAFHKGTGSLFGNVKHKLGIRQEIYQFGGDGTVDILLWLTYFFGDFDNFVKAK